MKPTKAVRRQKHPRKPIKLTTHEKLLLLFYNSVPPDMRQAVDSLIWARFSDPNQEWPFGTFAPGVMRRVQAERILVSKFDTFAAHWRTQPDAEVTR